jgi:hypothetical protein
LIDAQIANIFELTVTYNEVYPITYVLIPVRGISEIDQGIPPSLALI